MNTEDNRIQELATKCAANPEHFKTLSIEDKIKVIVEASKRR